MTHVQDLQQVLFAIDLANKHTRELGFLPATVYGPAHMTGRLKIVEENGEPCGFLLHGPPTPEVRIYQACVHPTTRMNDHGRELWLQTLLASLDADVEAITWICAEDLPANAFWERVSGPPGPLMTQRASHRRRLFQYRHALPRGKELQTYLDEQYRGSAAYKIAKLHGLENWLETKFKQRWRRNPK